MSSFSFGNISTSSSKKVLSYSTINNCLLVDRSESYATYDFMPIVLCDEPYDTQCAKVIENFLVSCGLTRFKMLSALNCRLDEKSIKKGGKIKFYKANKSDFEKYIPEGSPILTSGPALYSLLMEDDIFPIHCQQIIWGKSWFYFSKDLTRKNCHAVFPIESFRDIYARGFVRPVDSYKTKLAQIQVNTLLHVAEKPLPEYKSLNKIFIESKEDFIKRFYEPNKDKHNEVLAWDLETSGLEFYTNKIGCITLSFDGQTGYYVPWRIMDDECKKKLGEILKNNRQCGANLKFDVKQLWRHGVPEARIDEDIISLGHTMDETRSNSLKALAFFYSEYGGYERKLDAYKDKMGKNINYLDIPEEILRDYAIMDAIVTRRVWENMMAHLTELDKKYPPKPGCDTMENMYHYRRIPVDNMYAGVEYRGVYVNKDKLDALRKEINEYLDNIKSDLCKMFNVPSNFDWTSPQKLGRLLEERGWEDYGRNLAGLYATADFQLSRWAKTHIEARKLQEMRSINTLINTFVGEDTENSLVADFLGTNDEESDKGWTKCLTLNDEGKWQMFPTFQSLRADSNRSKCGNPNMQQVPARGKFSQEIKSCLCTPDDDNYYMVTMDYSALQTRLVAMTFTSEDLLSKTLKEPGADLHSSTARLVFHPNPEDIEIYTIESNGKTKDFLAKELVMTKNRGEVPACELLESDEIDL